MERDRQSSNRRHCAATALTLLCATASVDAAPTGLQVTPLWQARAEVVAPFDSTLGTVRADVLPDGTLVAVAQDTRSYIVSLRLDAADVRVDGQWGARAQGGTPTLQNLLAASASGSVLRIREPVGAGTPSFFRDATVLLDAAGNRRWAHPYRGTWAAFLPGGDVVLATEVLLLRLAAADGGVVWSVSLETLLAADEDLGSASFAVNDDSVTAAVRSIRPTLQGDVGIARLATFGLADGALRWSRERAPGLANTRLCGIRSRGDRTLQAWIRLSPAVPDLIVVQQRASDGVVLSSATAATVTDDDAHCDIVEMSGNSVVGTREDNGATVLVGIDAAGAVAWRSDADPGFGSTIARLGTSDDVVRVSRPEGLLRVERIRAADGQSVWSTSRPFDESLVAETRVAAAGGDVRVALPVATGVRLIELNSATGADSSSREVRPSPVFAPASTAAFIDGTPYIAQVVFRTASPELSVRRLQPETGALAWESFQPLPPDITIPNFGVALVRGNAATLLVRFSAPSAADAVVRRSFVSALSSADGSVIWRQDVVDRQDPGELATPEVLAAADAGILVRRKACASPTDCATAQSSVEFRSLASGATLWSRAQLAWSGAMSAQGVVVFGPDAAATSRVLALHAPADGQVLWSQVITPFWDSAGAIADVSGGLLSSYSISESGFGGLQRSVRLERRELSSGASPWTLQRGPSPDGFRTAMLTRATSSDVLLTAGRTDGGSSPRTSPYLERVDASSGSPVWVVSPPLPPTGLWTLRAFGEPQGPVQALRSIRQPILSPSIGFERWFVGAIDLGTATVGGEHLLFRRLDGVLGNVAILFLAHRYGDGTIGLVDLTFDPRGHQAATIARLPAASGPDVDIVMRVVDGIDTFSGLGPTAAVNIEVENVSPVAVADIELGAETRPYGLDIDGLPMRWVSCQLQGPAPCTVTPGVGTNTLLALGAGSVARLRLEVLDPQYRHARNGSGQALPLILYADAPYAFGDTAPENNVVEVSVRMGGFTDGFE
jgi:hypothetical protein